MTTISQVCANLFTLTTLSNLEKLPNRADRRALARVVYRQGHRPGLVNPQGPGERPVRKQARNLGVSRRPLRHVYKFHLPKLPKPGTLAANLRRHMVPKLFKYSNDVMRVKSGNPDRVFGKVVGRI